MHTPENQPEIEIKSPDNNTSFSSPDLEVQIETSAKRGVDRVVYYIDGEEIKTANSSPFNLTNFKLIGFNNGEHVLEARAFDDVDNNSSDQIKIKLNLPESLSQPIKFINPGTNAEIWPEMFPYTIEVEVANQNYFEKIDFYIKNKGESSGKWIGYKQVNNSSIIFTWENVPEPGEYFIYALSTDRYGNSRKSREIKIIIK